MTGKRFEAPRFDWNILAALGALSEMRTHWSDGRALLTGELFPAERISSPVQPVAAPPDLCLGKIEAAAGRPVSVAAVADCEVMP